MRGANLGLVGGMSNVLPSRETSDAGREQKRAQEANLTHIELDLDPAHPKSTLPWRMVAIVRAWRCFSTELAQAMPSHFARESQSPMAVAR